MNGRRKVLFVILGLSVSAAAWAAIDLWGRHTSDLRQFDADDVARLETAMWRSYYDKQPVRLFFQLAQVLRRQYRLPFLRSYVVAFYGARAAFVFKRGTRRSEYE